MTTPATICCPDCYSRFNTEEEFITHFGESHLERVSDEEMDDAEFESVEDTHSDVTSRALSMTGEHGATKRQVETEELTESDSEAEDHIIISSSSRIQSSCERTLGNDWPEDYRRPIGICDREIEWGHEKLLVQWSRGSDSWETRESLEVDQSYIEGWLNELEREKERCKNQSISAMR